MKFDTIVSTRVELSKVSLLMDIPYIYIFPKHVNKPPRQQPHGTVESIRSQWTKIQGPISHPFVRPSTHLYYWNQSLCPLCGFPSSWGNPINIHRTLQLTVLKSFATWQDGRDVSLWLLSSLEDRWLIGQPWYMIGGQWNGPFFGIGH